MAVTTQIKSGMNRWLKGANLRLETLTADQIESKRLNELAASGHFTRPVFSLLPSFQEKENGSVLSDVQQYRSRFEDFTTQSKNDVGYTFENGYYSSPDAEILYTLIRKVRPRTVLEVGSGNSTKITRQAILDGRMNTRLISIDPQPRVEVNELADELHRCPVERIDQNLFGSMKAGDILFIDSSHEIKTGNDVVFLYLNVIPSLASGVIIHIHDVFLPYDYPLDWVVNKRWGWNEQYLVHALLSGNHNFEVLWAGHFLQRTLPHFAQHFPQMKKFASSLWLRKSN